METRKLGQINTLANCLWMQQKQTKTFLLGAQNHMFSVNIWPTNKKTSCCTTGINRQRGFLKWINHFYVSFFPLNWSWCGLSSHFTSSKLMRIYTFSFSHGVTISSFNNDVQVLNFLLNHWYLLNLQSVCETLHLKQHGHVANHTGSKHCSSYSERKVTLRETQKSVG